MTHVFEFGQLDIGKVLRRRREVLPDGVEVLGTVG